MNPNLYLRITAIWNKEMPARTRFTLHGFDPAVRALLDPCSDVPSIPGSPSPAVDSTAEELTLAPSSSRAVRLTVAPEVAVINEKEEGPVDDVLPCQSKPLELDEEAPPVMDPSTFVDRSAAVRPPTPPSIRGAAVDEKIATSVAAQPSTGELALAPTTKVVHPSTAKVPLITRRIGYRRKRRGRVKSSNPSWEPTDRGNNGITSNEGATTNGEEHVSMLASPGRCRGRIPRIDGLKFRKKRKKRGASIRAATPLAIDASPLLTPALLAPPATTANIDITRTAVAAQPSKKERTLAPIPLIATAGSLPRVRVRGRASSPPFRAEELTLAPPLLTVLLETTVFTTVSSQLSLSSIPVMAVVVPAVAAPSIAAHRPTEEESPTEADCITDVLNGIRTMGDVYHKRIPWDVAGRGSICVLRPNWKFRKRGIPLESHTCFHRRTRRYDKLTIINDVTEQRDWISSTAARRSSVISNHSLNKAIIVAVEEVDIPKKGGWFFDDELGLNLGCKVRVKVITTTTSEDKFTLTIQPSLSMGFKTLTTLNGRMEWLISSSPTATAVSPQGRPPDPLTPTETMMNEGKMLEIIPESSTQMDVEGAAVQLKETGAPIATTPVSDGSIFPGMETMDRFRTNENTTTLPLVSYASAVAGSASTQQPPKQRWIPVGEHDLVPGTFNGEPELRVSDSFRNKLSAPWQRTLVVRLLGRSIGYSTLCNRLKALWRPTSAMEIFALDDDCFLVKLGNDKDYFYALSEGPWVIFDHYLVVHQWTPSFRVTDKLPTTMVLWVHFPGLPVHFYHQELLFALGNMIGRAIKLDYHTQHQQRAKFARMAVEVDLSKPLVPRIRLDGRWQKVEFENIPVVCFECGKVGHTKVTCPLICQDRLVADVHGTLPSSGSDAGEGDSGDVAGFGPWMLVTRKTRRNQREVGGQGKSDQNHLSNNAHKARNSGKGEEGDKERLESLPKLQSGKTGKVAGSLLGKKEEANKGKAPVTGT
ncbi:unnamed protein product [Linum tenue]|uniref:CCHC-type domain-containing protein n=1 Tax=Linum tenue TaxID=586396 RepID=A0AAV0HX02_9ROSI|nr:unnamed protein product [Linum tenue]